MTNVIPFVARADGGSVFDPVATARTTASVVADLVSMVAEIKEISGRVLPLPYDAREVERTIQALLDAISAIEHATDVLTQRRTHPVLRGAGWLGRAVCRFGFKLPGSRRVRQCTMGKGYAMN